MLFLFCFLVGCKNIDRDAVVSSETPHTFPTFNTTYSSLVSSIEDMQFDYKEVSRKTYSDGGDIKGVLYINDENEYDIIRIEIHHHYDKVYYVYVTYEISDTSSLNAGDALVQLYNTILSNIKPDVPNDFITTLEGIDLYYSRDYDDLRVSISYEELVNITVKATFVCIGEN